MNQQAHIPTQTITNSPVVNNEFADLETPRVLFMAMDGIPDVEKYELSFKAFGGMYLPHIAGLRESKYMLYRCRFTQLPSFTPVGEWDTMLPPEMRQHLQRSFTQTVSVDGKLQQKTVMGFLESDVDSVKEGVFKQKRSSHLLFHKRYPGNDARKATQRTAPHGVGGVVEIVALKGASVEQIEEAQNFFFPNWDVIARGDEALPSTVKDMEAHIKSRMAQIPNQLWDTETEEVFKSIGRDMLRSCSEFARHALNIVKGDEVTFKVAFEAGETQAQNSAVSEMMLTQTETRRKNDLISGEASATTELVKEMRADRAGNAEVAKKQLEIEERKLFLEEVRLGIRNPDGTLVGAKAPAIEAPAIEIPVENVYTENVDNPQVSSTIELCGQPKANGEPCARELKEGETACFQHTK
jgi:hypothetical protein